MKKNKRKDIALGFIRCSGFVFGLLIFLSAPSCLMAQSAVGATGGNATGNGGSASYTIGQVAYTNFSAEGGSVSLGVQQPNLFLTVGTGDLDITLSASVFPNPASSSTSLKLEGQNASTVEDGLAYSLYDLNGKLILQQSIQSTLTSIPMDKLTEGVYVLQVTRKNIEIKSFKVFKTN